MLAQFVAVEQLTVTLASKLILGVQTLEDLVDAVGEAKALHERSADGPKSAPVEVPVQVSRCLWHRQMPMLCLSLSS